MFAREVLHGVGADGVTGRGLVVKRSAVLSRVQMLNLVLGVGVFSLLPTKIWFRKRSF